MPTTINKTGNAGALVAQATIPAPGAFVTSDSLGVLTQAMLDDLATIKSVMEISAPATAQIPAAASLTGQGLGPTLDGVWRWAASLVLRGQGAGVQIQNAWRLAGNTRIASTSGAELSGAIKTVDLILATASRLVAGSSVGLAGSWLVEASGGTLGIAGLFGILGDAVMLVQGTAGHLAAVAFGQYSYTEFDNGAEIHMVSGSKITGTTKFDDGTETRFGLSTALNALGILNLKGNYTLDAAATLTQVAGSIINMQRTRKRPTVVVAAGTTPTLTTADGNTIFLQGGTSDHLSLGAGADGDWFKFTTDSAASGKWAIKVGAATLATMYGPSAVLYVTYWNSQWNIETMIPRVVPAPGGTSWADPSVTP